MTTRFTRNTLNAATFVPSASLTKTADICSDFSKTLLVDGKHLSGLIENVLFREQVKVGMPINGIDLPEMDITVITSNPDTAKEKSAATRLIIDAKGKYTLTNYHIDNNDNTVTSLAHMSVEVKNKQWILRPITPTLRELSTLAAHDRRELEDASRQMLIMLMNAAAATKVYEYTVTDEYVEFSNVLVDQRKFTPLKNVLMQKVFISKELKKLKLIGREINMAGKLEESILFTDIEFDIAPTSRLQAVSFTNLPFNDFMILTDAYWQKDDTLVKDGFMFRLKRTDKGRTYLFSYCLNAEGQYKLKTILEVMENDSTKTLLGAEDDALYITEAILGMKRFIHLITHYKQEVRHKPSKARLTHAKVGDLQAPLYTEYTLDLTKLVSKGTGGNGVAMGTHASPMEHERRGHYRQYRSGKKIFIETSTINKGSKGRSERDYKVN